MASPATAGKPEKVIIHEAFDEELCGIPVHTTVDGFFMLHIQDYVIQADDPSVEESEVKASSIAPTSVVPMPTLFS